MKKKIKRNKSLIKKLFNINIYKNYLLRNKNVKRH